MNIIEAVQSGKMFRRKHSSQWYAPFDPAINPPQMLAFYHSDLLLDDWEVEEEKIEVTKRQLKHVFENTAFSLFDDDKTKAFDYFAKKLGFK